MTDVKEVLKELGMTRNEIEIFLTILGSGPITVSGIAAKSGLYRQVCYDALERLMEKGFVNHVFEDNRKVFSSLEPEKILEFMEEKRDHVKEALPELIAITKRRTEGAHVEVYKGRTVLRTVYKDIYKEMKENGVTLYAMGVDETRFLEFDRIAIQQHIMRLRRAGFREKLLSTESAKTFFWGPQSEYRLIPDESFNPNPTHVYGDKIAIIVWGDPTYGIIIESKEVADSNRKYFKILWNIGKKIDRRDKSLRFLFLPKTK